MSAQRNKLQTYGHREIRKDEGEIESVDIV